MWGECSARAGGMGWGCVKEVVQGRTSCTGTVLRTASRFQSAPAQNTLVLCRHQQHLLSLPYLVGYVNIRHVILSHSDIVWLDGVGNVPKKFFHPLMISHWRNCVGAQCIVSSRSSLMFDSLTNPCSSLRCRSVVPTTTHTPRLSKLQMHHQ